MVDDKSKRDFRDRDRVSESEEYEVRHFAEQNGITMEQTRELIRLHGNSRIRLAAAAAELRRHRSDKGADQVTQTARSQETPMSLGNTKQKG